MDRLRVVTMSANKRPTTVLDINDDVNYALVRDTFAPKPSNRQPQYAQSGRRYGGARLVNETHDNGTIEAEWYITGTTANNALTKMSALLSAMEDDSGTRYLEWRMDGASSSVFYQLRGPATWEPVYRWIEVSQTHTMHLKGSWPIAPLGEGLSLDFTDDFSTNTITSGEWVVDQGTPTISGGLLVPGAPAVLHSAHTGYQHDDVQATLKFTTGAATAGSVRIFIKQQANGDRIILDFGAGGTGVSKIVSAVKTDLITSGTALAASTLYWLTLHAEGGFLRAEIWKAQPTPAGTPFGSLNVAMDAATALQFGQGIAGNVGIEIPSGTSAHTYQAFSVAPYTYYVRSLPEVRQLNNIPGDAPAKVDIATSTVAIGDNLQAYIGGWLPTESSTPNLVSNGDFEVNANGWLGNAADATLTSTWTNINVAGTPFARSISSSKFGVSSGSWAATGANQGTAYRIFRRFQKGRRYNISVWTRNDGTALARHDFMFGAGDADNAYFVNNQNPGTTWTNYTGTWVPTADYDEATVILKTGGGALATYWVDGITVYKDDVAPTTVPHLEGRGAFPPFGIIDAANMIPGFTANTWTRTADSTKFRSGWGLQATASGVFNQYAFMMIDPSLLHADDFQQGELVLEVWARVFYPDTIASPTMITGAYSYDSFSPGVNLAGLRFSHEYTGAPKTLQLPAAGTSPQQLVRAGTLTLPVDTANPGRWVFFLEMGGASGSTGTYGLDYVLLVPARQRITSPSLKPQDTYYPTFSSINTNGTQLTKVYRSDLTGQLRSGSGINPFFPDIGIGGQLIEFPPGNVQVVNVISNNALEPAPLSAVTISKPTVNASLHFAVTPRYFLGR